MCNRQTRNAYGHLELMFSIFLCVLIVSRPPTFRLLPANHQFYGDAPDCISIGPGTKLQIKSTLTSRHAGTINRMRTRLVDISL